MKNLLNTIVFKSLAVFAMVLLVAFAVTSSFNPLNPFNDIGGKDRDIIRYAPDNTNSIVDDIGGGGKGTSTTLREDIGGSKGIKGEIIDNQHEISDIGGRNSTTTGNFSVEDIGGRNGTGTSSGGEFHITDIGGRTTNTSDLYLSSDIGGRGNELGTGHYLETSTDQYYISDIGGRKDINTGNLTFEDIGGSRDHLIIRRIPVPFTSEIEGIKDSTGQ